MIADSERLRRAALAALVGALLCLLGSETRAQTAPAPSSMVSAAVAPTGPAPSSPAPSTPVASTPAPSTPVQTPKASKPVSKAPPRVAVPTPVAVPAPDAVPAKSPAPGLPRIVKVEPTEVVWGTPVKVTGEFFPAKPEHITIFLDDFELGHPIDIASDGKSFDFIVPKEIERGATKIALPRTTYMLRVAWVREGTVLGATTPAQRDAGYVRVVSDSRKELKLTNVRPALIGPRTHDVVLMGEGFGGTSAGYSLLIDDQDVPVCWSEPCAEGIALRGVVASDHEIKLGGRFPSMGTGPRMLSLRSDDTINAASAQVLFTEMVPSQIKETALQVSAALLLLVLVIALLGGGPHKVYKTTYWARAFLIDPETDTYSLSKLQFYAWSAAAVFGYFYLTLSRTLIQGQLSLAEVPDNLPGILAISAGTAMLAAGIAKGRGPKAAGGVQPSFSDLITTGGVVSPERFQFLLWTLVAIAGFVLLLLRTDPGTSTDLPKVPDSLLILSGISAACYLGGKLVRAPGPVVDEIIARPGSLELVVIGRNLSANATFLIDGQPITGLLGGSNDESTLRPNVLELEKEGSDLAKRLLLRVVSPESLRMDKEQPFPEVLTLTVVNPDNQKAVWPVKLSEALRYKIETLVGHP